VELVHASVRARVNQKFGIISPRRSFVYSNHDGHLAAVPHTIMTFQLGRNTPQTALILILAALSRLGRVRGFTAPRNRPTFSSAHETAVERQQGERFSRRRSSRLFVSQKSGTREGKVGIDRTKDATTKSRIRSIRSHNLAGVLSADEDASDIVIPFSQGTDLVAVTGETGSGKSLLVARVVELLTGGKASSTFLASTDEQAFVEMELTLQ
jgi:hypothetical protein